MAILKSLLLLLILAWVALAVDPPQGCNYSSLTCANGYFNSSKCVSTLNLQNGTFPWASVNNCTCDPGWQGADCSLADGPSECKNGSGVVFDGSFYNPKLTKAFECFLYEEQTYSLPLADHRVDLQLDIKNGAIGVHIYSRVNAFGTYLWGPVLEIIQCNLTECTASVSPKDHNVTYTCLQSSCSACRLDQGCVQFILILGAIKPPLYIKMKNINQIQYISDLDLFIPSLANTTLFLHCTTGNCIDLCATTTCQNGGTCVFVNDANYCLCPNGFSGNDCSLKCGSGSGSGSDWAMNNMAKAAFGSLTGVVVISLAALIYFCCRQKKNPELYMGLQGEFTTK